METLAFDRLQVHGSPLDASELQPGRPEGRLQLIGQPSGTRGGAAG